MNSIATGSEFIFNVHEASHGAGQILPVNSGKLLVACNCDIAFFQSPFETRSFQSGIRFPRGQPLLQKGTPQSMHLEACCPACFSVKGK